ncbi:hypothetical protein FOMG_18706 [Fusarium oxysporum f. sp. melonis 26406]|uniref:Uncharacterized protein n=1 Tax=Fusarium oxysporum f. sp. melonis 26406 TaxID=1089452 RepID=W9YZM9_FUSOX|nr:hypothetical protein FOMG_18706 [Fusarium oxysporum f. sp. melonis 26406]
MLCISTHQNEFTRSTRQMSWRLHDYGDLLSRRSSAKSTLRFSWTMFWLTTQL